MVRNEYSVAATRTSLRIVEELKRLDGAGVTEIADELDMPKSTVHNHLRTLADERYVVREGGTYRIGLRFLELGEYTRNRRKIYQVARPEVSELAEETAETVNAAVEEHGEGIYITRAHGDRAVSDDTYAGKRMKLHCTALGKSILAELPESRVAEIVETHGLPRRTENTITDLGELEAELESIRERGYAYDREERLRGVRCVAAPVVTEDGSVVASLSVSGPTRRMEGDRFHEDLPELLRSSANVVEINMTYA